MAAASPQCGGPSHATVARGGRVSGDLSCRWHVLRCLALPRFYASCHRHRFDVTQGTASAPAARESALSTLCSLLPGAGCGLSRLVGVVEEGEAEAWGGQVVEEEEGEEERAITTHPVAGERSPADFSPGAHSASV